MRLGPGQVRLLTPFWPTPVGRTLRFTGRRNSVQLQETALVAEGDLLLFACLGLERLFGRALSARTTVTVPYSRIAAVRYRRPWVLRALLLTGLAVLLAVALQLPRTPFDTWDWMEALADAIILVPACGLAALVWWRLQPAYTLRFRAGDGRRTRLHFAVRSRAVRRAFDAALADYRRAAGEYTREGAP